jgi:4-hydroxyphenylpyruvate dioxygenase
LSAFNILIYPSFRPSPISLPCEHFILYPEIEISVHLTILRYQFYIRDLRSIMAPSAIGPTVIASNGAVFPLSSGDSVKASTRNGYRGYHHMTWYVGNAKQAASYYVTRLGFKAVARRGLESGSRNVASWVVSNGGATFVLQSPLRSPISHTGYIEATDDALLREIHNHLEKHGDGVKDVAFEVDDVTAVFDHAVAGGAAPIQPPTVTKDGKNGEILTAKIQTYGDTTHTLIDCTRYTGRFLPGFQEITVSDPISSFLPSVRFEEIDHCVGNQDWDGLEAVCE